MQFKDYFNAYDTVGNLHNGFLQAMDFSAFTDVTMLNELTMALMDAHLQNELSGSLVLKQWAKYMHFSKENDRLEVWAQFYTDFKNALYAKLLKSEKWYQITKTDFTSLSATDIKTIEHGSKVTDFDYAQAQKTRQYGQKQQTNAYGAQVEQSDYAQLQNTDVYGAGVKQNEYGPTSKTYGHDAVVNQKDYDKVVVEVSHDGNDSHVIGAGGSTTTHKLFPLGASAYVDDTQDSTTTQAQTNTDTWAKVTTETDGRTDVDTTAARTDSETSVLHTDVETIAEKTDRHTSAAHTDVVTEAAHTDTLTDAQHTDTETDAAKKDTQTIKAYTDTERHTKHIVLSPDKYFEIEKEMTELGVYDLMLRAVRDTMLLNVWEEGACEWN